MDTYIRLSNRFYYDRANKTLIDMSTGEVHKTQDEIKTIFEALLKDKEFNRDMERQLRQDFELPTELEEYQQNWKRDSWFIKVYRTEMRKHKQNTRLSASAGLLLTYLQDYIEYKTNRISHKDKSFTNKELATLTGLSENPIVNSLNELEEKHFIKRVGIRRAREIYFNPYLACSGNEVSKSTLELFANYIKLSPY